MLELRALVSLVSASPHRDSAAPLQRLERLRAAMTEGFATTDLTEAARALTRALALRPDEPVTLYRYARLLFAQRQDDAALVALNFLMSVPGQSAIVGKEEGASPLPNVPGSLDMKKLKMQMIDPETYPPERVKAFEAKWNELFKAR